MKILRNILFYFLFFILGFLLGIQYANITEAGKGQMLAGGAIVLGHGVSGSIIGLAISIFLTIVYKERPKIIIQSNKILGVLIFSLIVFFYTKYQIKYSKTENSIGCEVKKIKDLSVYLTL